MQMTTEGVWESFSTQLRHYIRKQVRDEGAAEDILQEVFLRIHAHGATVRTEEKLTGWLYQVTRNAITDHYRRRSGDRSSPLPEDAADRFAMPEADEIEQAIQALLPCVRAMVEALPHPYREALMLTEYEGLSQRALADQLGLSFSGAKTRVQRAREKLRTLLLACCHLEFDHAGRVIDYHPDCACCAAGSCAQDACSTDSASASASEPETESTPGGVCSTDEECASSVPYKRNAVIS